MKVHRWALVGAVFFFLISAARADGDDGMNRLDRCLAPVTASVEARGAVVRSSEARFLLEGESSVHSATVSDAGGCVGFLAFGARHVRDLDLTIFTTTGTSLVEDVATNAHPYARFCGAPGLSLRVVVRMYQGQGAYRLVTVDNAPPSLDDLATRLGPCAGPGDAGTAEPPPELGADPPGLSLDEAARRAVADLRDRGYVALDTAIRGDAAQGRPVRHALDLGVGDCYAILAVGDRGILDLDMTVVGSTRGRVSRDASRERNAVVRLCPDEPSHMIEVRAYRGGGAYRMHVFRLVEHRLAQRNQGIDGMSRVYLGEWAARASRRGFGTEVVTWASVAPGAPLDVPLRLERGKCYAIGAIPAPDFQRGDIDVLLTDREGRLLSWDVGPDNAPTAFLCPDEDRDVFASLRLSGAARARVILLMASDVETSR